MKEEITIKELKEIRHSIDFYQWLIKKGLEKENTKVLDEFLEFIKKFL